jgi:protein tyrosine phosphatase
METCADFWRMVWEQNTVTIVMLTNLEENDKVKCFQYWPEEKEQEYGNIVVRVDRDIILPHYTIRGFKVFNRATNDEERTVLQFHYTAWPDNNVPAQAAPLLDFLRAINSANDSDAYGPMVVHCSAGVGRTGTIISLDIALAQLKDTGFVDVKGIVKFLRQQRIEMVQVVEQYVFIHHAILEDIIYGDTSVLLKDFIDHYNALQSSPGMPIDGEYYKIGKVRPPAQAFAGPNIVPSIKDIPCDDDLFIAHYLDSYWIPNFFVATSCPSNGNIERFWQLVWDQKATHIVNLTPQDSSAVFNYMKGKEMIINNMRIKIDSTEIKKGYILRKVIIIREEKVSLFLSWQPRYHGYRMNPLLMCLL